MLRIQKSALVEQDIWEIAEHISHDNIEAAIRFVDAVEEAFSVLAQFPESGPSVRIPNVALVDWRFKLVPRFSAYLVFYRFDDATVIIERVLHGARNLPSVFE